jgi:hypothetical protein
MWTGPILAVLGLLAIAGTFNISNQSPLARWILVETLAPSRVLPLIGIAISFALVSTRAMIAGLLFFGFGAAIGLTAEDWLLAILAVVPGAATHLFLTEPFSYLAAGLALIAGKDWRRWVTPPAALIFGAMIGLTIKLTDPSLHEPAFSWLPTLTSCWIIAAVMLTLRAFSRGWFAVFGRILGSWFIAIGLLYGGASLVTKHELPPPVIFPPPPVSPAEPTIPGLSEPDQRTPFPGGASERFRQP